MKKVILLVISIPLFINLIMCTGLNGTQGDRFVPYSQAVSGSDLSVDMVAIKSGEFMMGSPTQEPGRNKDEGPQHKVSIDPFWMSTTEVTWNLYELFLKRKIDYISEIQISHDVKIKIDAVSGATPPYTDMSFGMGKDGYPAINMTQYAASTFCKWLSAKTGHFYRLPTEAEWEYAARADTTSAYYFGDDISKLGDYAWYKGNSNYQYQKVAQKKPNAWGLYDMHGNVAEWTLDQYVPDYYQTFKNSTASNPYMVAKTLYPRVVRGGAWDDNPERLRSAARYASKPKWKQRDPQLPKSLWWLTDASFVGFRIVRPLKPPAENDFEKYWTKPITDL